MLTIKSNFINYRDRQGQEYTNDDLTRLASAVLSSDIVNFRENNGTNIGRGFPSTITAKIIEKISGKPESILIINDVSLHMTKALLEAGYQMENIYLAFGKWEKNATPSSDRTVVSLMKNYVRANFNEALNIISLGDVFMAGKSWGLIIANPPYGSIGANITKKIIDNVEFEEYVNLLPANDYKRNSSKDLYNYQSDMESVNDGFADAKVTTHVALIHKDKVNNMTLDEFERSQYIDPQLDKYFAENSKRNHYAIDAMPSGGLLRKTAGIWDITKTFIIGMRDMNHKHLPYSKKSVTYKWNIENTGTMQSLPAMTNDTQLSVSHCLFNTNIEKKNFVEFIYSDLGFKFTSKIFVALNCDGTVHSIAFPKVDWTRSWTVEEILKDYGYTDEEVQAVMDDLKNFKGMDD